MSWIRDFSSSEGFVSPVRNIEADAPAEMRHELIDLVFRLAPQGLGEEHIYHVICQSLGEMGAGNP